MGSTDTARVAIVEEVTRGVTPATPAFQILRLDSDSLTWETDSVQDPELNASRELRDVIQTGANVAGDITGPWAANTTFELMLESIFGDVFTADALVPGTTIKTFTIEKRYEDGSGGYVYHRFAGVTFSRLVLSQSPDELVQATWTPVGGQFTVDTAEIVGATYADPSPTHALAPRMTGAELAVQPTGPTPLAQKTWTSVELTIDSQNFATKELGLRGESDLHQGKFIVQVTADLVFEGDGIDQAWLAETRVPLNLIYTDRTASPNNHVYQFELLEAKISAAPTETGPTGELVSQAVTVDAVLPSGGALCTLYRSTS